jgi:hypothetical protein
VTATTPTRLEILEHAREIALAKGAVKNGSNYFEAPRFDVDALRGVGPTVVQKGTIQPDAICGVCIAGACMLAEVELGVPYDDMAWSYSWLSQVEPTAVLVASEHGWLDNVDPDEHADYAVTRLINHQGTDYVVEVLDRMIAAERDAVTA